MSDEPLTRVRLDWEEARSIVSKRVEPLAPIRSPLIDADGLTTAEDVLAPVALPGEPRSAVDGWAVNGSGPWIIAEPGTRLTAHQAVQVGKGRPVPPGTKAVLPLAEARIGLDADGLAVVERSAGARPGAPRNGENLIPVASFVQTGDLLMAAGTVLLPPRLAFLAAAGLDTVPVLPRPLVQLIQSGELQPSGHPVPGATRDALGPVLEALLRAMGAAVVGRSRIRGTVEEWRTALAEEAEGTASLPDVVLTIGGTGDGEGDSLRASLEAMGAEYLIDGLSTIPLQSVLLGVLPDGRHVLGLPGSPREAFTALAVLGAPLLDALGRRAGVAPRPVPSGTGLEARLTPTRLVPGRSVFGMASPCGHDGGLRDWADATVLLALPPHGLRMGDDVLALPLPWLEGVREAPGAPRPVAVEERGNTSQRAVKNGRAGRAPRPKGPIDWEAQDWGSLKAPGS